MTAVLRPLVGVARFLYHFAVGDDWLVAAVMLIALVVTALLVQSGVNAWWLVPALGVVMTGIALWRRPTA